MGTSAYGEEPRPPARAETSVRRMFTLGETAFAIVVPERAEVSYSAASGHELIVRDLSRSTRLERLLILGKSGNGSDAGYDRYVTLANGIRLEFRIDDETGGGSGGPIAQLAGRMTIGAHILTVRCTDQGEFYQEPDWCLPYLGRLEIVQSGR